jgi:hypothetical protein
MKFWIFIFFLVVALGCKKEFDSPNFNQEILFEVTYMNNAWGYQHNGFMVDSAGIVWTYNLPKDWNFVDADGFITAIAMKENLNKLSQTTMTVNKDTLLKYYNKLTGATHGEITKPKTEMYDAGSTLYSGYIYDSRTERYQKILIKQFGDVYIENKSKEANDIYNWLIRINVSAKN